MPAFDLSDAKFAPTFVPENLEVLVVKSSRGAPSPVVAYDNNFKGKDYFHIREIWADQNDVWNIGKGLSVPAEMKNELLAAIAKLAAPAAPAPVSKTGTRKIKAA